MNSVLILFLLRRFGISAAIAILSASAYFFCHAHTDNILWAMQSSVFLSIALLLLALWTLFLFVESGNGKYNLCSAVLAVLCGLAFGFGLVSPILLVIFAAIRLSWKDPLFLRIVRLQSAALLALMICYKAGAAFENQTANHLGAVARPLSAEAIESALSAPAFWGSISRGLVAIPSEEIFHLRFSGTEVVANSIYIWVAAILLYALAQRSVAGALIPIFLYLLAMLALVVPPSLTRYPFGSHIIFADRYQAFLILPGIILLACAIDTFYRKLNRSFYADVVVTFMFAGILLLNQPYLSKIKTTKLNVGDLSRSSYTKVRECLQTDCKLDLVQRTALFNSELNPELTWAEALRIGKWLEGYPADIPAH